MSLPDFLVDRTIIPVEFNNLVELVKLFNKNHEISRIKILWDGKERSKIEYKSKKEYKVLIFNTFREAERWINYTNLADIY